MSVFKKTILGGKLPINEDMHTKQQAPYGSFWTDHKCVYSLKTFEAAMGIANLPK